MFFIHAARSQCKQANLSVKSFFFPCRRGAQGAEKGFRVILRYSDAKITLFMEFQECSLGMRALTAYKQTSRKKNENPLHSGQIVTQGSVIENAGPRAGLPLTEVVKISGKR